MHFSRESHEPTSGSKATFVASLLARARSRSRHNDVHLMAVGSVISFDIPCDTATLAVQAKSIHTDAYTIIKDKAKAVLDIYDSDMPYAKAFMNVARTVAHASIAQNHR